MNRDARLQALSDFLKSHRAKIAPASVGLPAGGRRRTPGLRREEVAQIAGVSSTWYTWLEQGRHIKASSQVLERIAMALNLTEDERKYLFLLALEPSAQQPPVESPTVPSSALMRIIEELQYCPALVSDHRCNIVGWNRAAAAVFIDFSRIEPTERNMIWLLFSRKEFRTLAVNWNDFVQGFVAMFRSHYGQYVGDPWYGEFIERVSRNSPEFTTFWKNNDVSSAPEVMIEFRHAKAGKMLFDLTSLQVQGRTDLRCSVYTPSAGTDTEVKMRQLMRKLGAK